MGSAVKCLETRHNLRALLGLVQAKSSRISVGKGGNDVMCSRAAFGGNGGSQSISMMMNDDECGGIKICAV